MMHTMPHYDHTPACLRVIALTAVLLLSMLTAVACGDDGKVFQLLDPTVEPQALAFDGSATLPGAIVGTAYSTTITATGGTEAGYQWALATGSNPLPDGISGIPGSGTPTITLSGTPTAADTYTFTVEVVDSEGETISQPFTLTVTAMGGPTISTVAGNRDIGDGGPANQALLNNPRGMAYDATNNLLYIADTDHHRVRVVDLATGIIDTFAGTGDAGFCTSLGYGATNKPASFTGDGRVATEADLNRPYSVAIHPSSGDLYIADYGNARVAKVDITTGILTTIAGSGFTNRPLPAMQEGSAFTMAILPTDIEFDGSGHLYVTDALIERVRYIYGNFVDSSWTTVVVMSQGLIEWEGELVGIARDAAGELYMCENGAGLIYKVENASGSSPTLTTIAGGGGYGAYFGDGGPALDAAMLSLTDLTFDAAGNLYVLHSTVPAVRWIDTAGIIDHFAGAVTIYNPTFVWGEAGYEGDGGPAVDAKINSPGGLAADTSGNVYIADTLNGLVRIVDSAGTINTFAGSSAYAGSTTFGDGAGADQAILSDPQGMTLDPATSDYYISDSAHHRVRVVDGTTGIIDAVAGSGTAGSLDHPTNPLWGTLNTPVGLAYDSATGLLYIADSGSNKVRVLDQAGATLTTLAGTGTAGFSGDGSLAVDAELNNPVAVALDSAGNVYIADKGNHCIRMVTAAGNISTVAGVGESSGSSGTGGVATSALLDFPSGLAVHPTTDELYISDRNNHRVIFIDSSGNLQLYAGSGSKGYSGDSGTASDAELNYPHGLTFAPTGELYIADRSNHAVRMVDTSGVISTLCGSGVSGFSGDGGPAVLAELNFPIDLAVGATGAVYVVDRFNNRIRKVE